jgi:hypothetical protein
VSIIVSEGGELLVQWESGLRELLKSGMSLLPSNLYLRLFLKMSSLHPSLGVDLHPSVSGRHTFEIVSEYWLMPAG